MHSTTARTWVAVALAAAAGAVVSLHAYAQQMSSSTDWTVTLDGQYRARGEFDSGKDFLGERTFDREWLSHRARLGATAGRKDGPQVTLRLQDTRVWGEESDPAGGGTQSGTALGLDMHEAYAQVPLGLDGLKLKAGRQEIALDNHRLVGNVDWTMRARAFDGARVQYAADKLDVSLFATMVNERDTADADGHVPAGRPGDVYFGGVHGKYTFGDFARLSAMFLSRKNDSIDPKANELRHTAGVYGDGKVADLTWSGEGYAQFGHLGADDVSAWMTGVRAAYTAPVAAKPTVAAWFETLSGDGNAATAFDTLYATNHKFYGEMDFFLNIPKHTGNRGLQDIAVALSCMPLEGLSAGADFHVFATHALAGDALKAAGDKQPSTDLGRELDVRVLWKIRPGLSLHALYGLFLPGDGMRSVRKLAANADLTSEQYGALTLDTWF